MFSYQQVKFMVVNKYLILLLSFFVFLICYPLSIENPIGISILHTFLILTILKISYLIQRQSHYFKFNLFLGIMIIIIFPFILFYPNHALRYIRLFMFFAFYGINIFILLRDITQKRRITKDIILGSLCVYIMIAVFYAGIYTTIELNYPGSFHFNSGIVSSTLEKTFNFAYFSFSTLTTVGFGDILPYGYFAKGIVVLEQVTGIFYLAVLVSRLVPNAQRNH